MILRNMLSYIGIGFQKSFIPVVGIVSQHSRFLTAKKAEKRKQKQPSI